MLIVLEGVDSSGKQTQTEKLYAYLSSKERTMQITFPDYQSDSSALVKLYLSGAFGEKADAVSPYAASTFYAADRYASYKMKWGDFLSSGGVVICDRYTTSNMVHQAAKLENTAEKDAFLDWIYDFEYTKTLCRSHSFDAENIRFCQFFFDFYRCAFAGLQITYKMHR